MALDGLTDAFDQVSMGESTERHNAKLSISRRDQDEFAARSHQLAAKAIKDGVLAEEIVPVAIPQRRGEPEIVATDEGVRAGTTAESLAGLKPAFAADGTITAGSASQISDGACAVVVMSAEAAAAAGATVLAEVGAHGVVAGPDNSLHSQPSRAIERALGKAGLQVSDLDLIEINEAFAAVALQSMRDLGLVGRSRERERRRHRHRPPARRVRRASRAAPYLRAATPRRRARRCRPVRRRRAGRCAAVPAFQPPLVPEASSG